MPVFPQYQSWSKKWEYLLSVPDIAPKKKSFVVFYDTVKRQQERSDMVPLEIKQAIIKKISSDWRMKSCIPI
ncbi:hypothetical protein DF182_19170 [Chitinophaga flava]|uniref:Uncharacterized protein n=1 Tax=Chitinophaga flava TaxID=2259036 RepID=A0A365XRB9_9BACT|nr:hypothetical protein DF182_19170 [Chitinophaga flava]